jgi:hypothetical protein
MVAKQPAPLPTNLYSLKLLRGIMARRTGIPSMIKYIKKLLDLISNFLGVILLLFPDDTEVEGLITDAQTSLTALLGKLETLRDYGD